MRSMQVAPIRSPMSSTPTQSPMLRRFSRKNSASRGSPLILASEAQPRRARTGSHPFSPQASMSRFAGCSTTQITPLQTSTVTLRRVRQALKRHSMVRSRTLKRPWRIVEFPRISSRWRIALVCPRMTGLRPRPWRQFFPRVLRPRSPLRREWFETCPGRACREPSHIACMTRSWLAMRKRRRALFLRSLHSPAWCRRRRDTR